MSKVAVVTGSNKGIGFAIVRALCKQFDGIVYLTGLTFEVLLWISENIYNNSWWIIKLAMLIWVKQLYLS